MQATIDIPFILKVEDYHEFDVAVEYFKAAGIKLKFVEVGFDGEYVAVFYMKGQRKDAQELIDKWKRETVDA